MVPDRLACHRVASTASAARRARDLAPRWQGPQTTGRWDPRIECLPQRRRCPADVPPKPDANASFRRMNCGIQRVVCTAVARGMPHSTRFWR